MGTPRIVDIDRALDAPTPSWRQTAPKGLGTGLLELSRGKSHVSDGTTELVGEQDIFGNPYDSARMAALEEDGSTWSDGLWNGASWAGSNWSGASLGPVPVGPERRGLERPGPVPVGPERRGLERPGQGLVGQGPVGRARVGLAPPGPVPVGPAPTGRRTTTHDLRKGARRLLDLICLLQAGH